MRTVNDNVVCVCTECSDIDVANTLVQLKRSAESRRPLGCRNGSADRSSRSPSPPEFGADYDRSFLRLKLRSDPSVPHSLQYLLVTYTHTTEQSHWCHRSVRPPLYVLSLLITSEWELIETSDLVEIFPLHPLTDILIL